MRVLFAAAEVYPLAKTGGLADVAAALPAALQDLGVCVCTVMPAYPGVRERLRAPRELGVMLVRGHRLRLWAGGHPDSGVPMLLVDAPGLFERAGSYYGHPDDAQRFGIWCAAVAAIADGSALSVDAPALCESWPAATAADVVHLNDWHTGLVPQYLRPGPRRPRCLFTIHNLAYQGCFGRSDYDALGLPAHAWHPRGLEFYGKFSFLKAGLLGSDLLTTVSPSYAREIQTPEFGEGLDGVLRERATRLHGILNGIDTKVWDPTGDPLIAMRYDLGTLEAGKAANRRALQTELGLDVVDLPVLGFIGRLARQKGADALLAARAELAQLPVQIAVLASGDAELERGLQDWAAHAPGQFAVRLAYDEGLAHRIEAGSDMFLMPSRYEPCGLNQMYSQRYGTIPLVRRVGGLADSVIDYRDDAPTGVHFEHSDAGGVSYAVRTALSLYAQPERWRSMQINGMRHDWGWPVSARRYLALYERLQIADQGGGGPR